MKKLKRILISATILFTIFCSTTCTFADVGGIQRYSSGGSSSSSSSHRSSSSSSSSHRSSSSSSSSGGSVGTSLGGVIVILIIFGILAYLKRKGINTTLNTFNNNVGSSNNTQSIEEKIRETDPMFSAEGFMAFSREVFVKLQTAWSERKWEEIRPFESNELFSQHSKQLQQLIDTNRINVVDRVAVRHTHLNNFTQDGDKEILTMTLKAVMRDYIIEADSKKVLEGNPNEDMYMVYTLTFMRKAGVKTKEGTDHKSTTNCPNCGAPTKITSSGKCEYCGSIVTTGEHDWVLTNLEGRPGM